MKFLTCTALSILTLTSSLSAQSITATERKATIEATLKLLNEQYVFPDVASQMEKHIRQQLRSYETITDGHKLASQLTNDLRSISHDKHLNIGYYPQGVPAEQIWHRKPSPDEEAAQKTFMKEGLLHENFGILDLSVLKGNLGYINFKYLAPLEFAGDSYVAAMNYLAKTDALIIDLRQCGGAMSEHVIPMLCSYFFAKPTHVNDFYWRDGNRTIQSWTYVQVQGKQYGNKPIYVLTSRQTFSGAEELAYDLKNLKRATIVGDTTGGGANPGGTMQINEHFAAFMPVGRAINPITKTNWEGVGVIPDTAVSANRALYTAKRMALQKLAADTSFSTEWRGALTGIASELTKQASQYVRQAFTLKGYPDAKEVWVTGSFNNWSQSNRLVRQGDRWVSDVEVEPGRITYKFIVDGQWIMDPANTKTEGDGQYMNSVIDVVKQ